MSEEQLILAAKEGNLEKVKELLALKLSIDHKDNHGITALAWAISKCHPKIVKFLIDNGASIDFEFSPTQFVLATANIDESTLNMIFHLASGPDVHDDGSLTSMAANALKSIFGDSTALFTDHKLQSTRVTLLAASMSLGDLEIAEILLSSGAPIDFQDSRIIAIQDMRGPKTKMMFEKHQNIRNFNNLRKERPGYLSVLPTDIINVIGHVIAHMFDYDIDQSVYHTNDDIIRPHLSGVTFHGI